MAMNRDANTGADASAPREFEEPIEVGYHVFTADGGEEVGAVRSLTAQAVVVYVENAGEFEVPLDAVSAVHFQKVILNCARLDAPLRNAIGHAHDDEAPGL